MSNAASDPRVSAAEFLGWEREQTDKHEFYDGEVFAMAEDSPRHNLLSSAIAAELRAAVRGKGCHVLSSDQRIAATPGSRYVYADAVVVCGRVETQADAADVLVNPSVVVEVLSRSTETHDRGMKWEAYQRLPSLGDYLLVAQGQARVEHFRRQGDGAWRYSVLEAGDTITLTNGAQLAVDAIHEGAFDVDPD